MSTKPPETSGDVLVRFQPPAQHALDAFAIGDVVEAGAASFAITQARGVLGDVLLLGALPHQVRHATRDTPVRIIRHLEGSKAQAAMLRMVSEPGRGGSRSLILDVRPLACLTDRSDPTAWWLSWAVAWPEGACSAPWSKGAHSEDVVGVEALAAKIADECGVCVHYDHRLILKLLRSGFRATLCGGAECYFAPPDLTGPHLRLYGGAASPKWVGRLYTGPGEIHFSHAWQASAWLFDHAKKAP